MKRIGLFLFLAGIALVMSSCVPVGYTLINILAPEKLEQVSLNRAGPSAITLQVPESGNKQARVALRVTFTQRDAATAEDLVVDYDYSITGNSGATLQRHRGRIDYDNSSARIGPAVSDRAWSTYEKVFDGFPVTPGEQLKVAIELSPKSPLAEAHLRLYAPAPEARISLFTALVVWVLGIIFTLTGGLLMLQTMATTADAGRAQTARASVAMDQGAADSVRDAPSKEQRIWAMVCHLTVFSSYLLLPFGHLIGPLVIWLAKREQSHFIDWHGREALNFNLSVTLYTLAGLLLCLTIIGLFVGLIVLFLVVVLHVAAALYVAIRAQQGDWARYPLSLRFIGPPPPARRL